MDDADRLVSVLREAVASALDEGYDAVRSTGETAWTLEPASDPAAVVTYESRSNALDEEHPWTVLCQYDRSRFTAAFIEDVFRAHPRHRGKRRYANEFYDRDGAFDGDGGRTASEAAAAFS